MPKANNKTVATTASVEEILAGIADPARAKDVAFSPPYMEVDNTYLVTATSKVESADAADRTAI